MIPYPWSSTKEKIESALQKLNANPQSADFDKIAGELGLKSALTAPFTYGSYIEGIGASDLFWDKARELSADPKIEIQIVSYGFARVKPMFMPAAPIPVPTHIVTRA